MQTAAKEIADLADLFQFLPPEEIAEIDDILSHNLPKWVPITGINIAGPQLQAYESEADIVYYGGAAGGAKSDLLLGLALNEHQKSIIYRREGTQSLALIDRLGEILGGRNGWNGQKNVWRLPAGKQIEFGSTPNMGDEKRYMGRPHDLIGFDELPNFLEHQFRFLCAWNRTTVQGQRCRIVCTGNPPTDADGAWVIRFWAPWLDPQHPNPAKPGELRWYAMIDGVETEVESGEPFQHNGKTIKPKSRTFIASRIQDNPFLIETDYESTLQALPEPLRSQMLEGNFQAGREDNPWQVIPSAWVDAAMERWTPDGKRGPMDSVGLDVARGGKDKTIISTRYGTWYAPLHVYPGSATPNGAVTAGLVISLLRDGAPIHIDVIGVGGETVGHLESNNIHVVSIAGNESVSDDKRDKASQKLRFRNLRALIYWRFRESLDPINGDNIMLPPDQELKADLCSPLWKLTPGGILIEAKEEIKKRIGRSPDRGDAVVYCSVNTPKRSMRMTAEKANQMFQQYSVGRV